MSQQTEPPTAECSAVTKEEGADRYEVLLSDGALCRSAPPGLPSPEANDTVLGRAFPALSTVIAVHPSVPESKVLVASTAAEAGPVKKPIASRDLARMSANPARISIIHLHQARSIAERLTCWKWYV